MSSQPVTDGDYQQLLGMRTWLRRFLKWSADQARQHGLTSHQHQLLLAVRGHPDPLGPTISDVAGYLQLRHNSTVELIDRAQQNRLVERRSDPDDGRLVRLELTSEGSERLSALAETHLQELDRLIPRLNQLWIGIEDVDQQQRPPGSAGVFVLHPEAAPSETPIIGTTVEGHQPEPSRLPHPQGGTKKNAELTSEDQSQDPIEAR